MPERFILCATRVLFAASTTPEPMVMPRSLRLRYRMRLRCLRKKASSRSTALRADHLGDAARVMTQDMAVSLEPAGIDGMVWCGAIASERHPARLRRAERSRFRPCHRAAVTKSRPRNPDCHRSTPKAIRNEHKISINQMVAIAIRDLHPCRPEKPLISADYKGLGKVTPSSNAGFRVNLRRRSGVNFERRLTVYGFI